MSEQVIEAITIVSIYVAIIVVMAEVLHFECKHVKKVFNMFADATDGLIEKEDSDVS